MVVDELRLAGHDVDIADLKTSPSAHDRDLVVLGSGIQAGQWYPEAVAWASAHGAQSAGGPVALFNVCLNAADPAKRDESLGYNNVVAGRLTPVAQESFGGRYVPERVSWVKRIFLKGLQKPRQDHVDEVAVRAWARSLDELIGA